MYVVNWHHQRDTDSPDNQRGSQYHARRTEWAGSPALFPHVTVRWASCLSGFLRVGVASQKGTFEPLNAEMRMGRAAPLPKSRRSLISFSVLNRRHV